MAFINRPSLPDIQRQFTAALRARLAPELTRPIRNLSPWGFEFGDIYYNIRIISGRGKCFQFSISN